MRCRFRFIFVLRRLSVLRNLVFIYFGIVFPDWRLVLLFAVLYCVAFLGLSLDVLVLFLVLFLFCFHTGILCLHFDHSARTNRGMQHQIY